MSVRTGLRQGENNRFGCINHRTAAQRDNQIRIAVIHPLHTAHHGGDIRVGHHVVPDLESDAARIEDLRDAIGEAKLNHRLVGGQQHVAGGQLVQDGKRILTKANPGFQQKFTHWVIDSLSVPKHVLDNGDHRHGLVALFVERQVLFGQHDVVHTGADAINGNPGLVFHRLLVII